MSYVDWSHLPRKELPLRPARALRTFLAYAAGMILSVAIGVVAILLHNAGDQARNGIDFMGP